MVCGILCHLRYIQISYLSATRDAVEDEAEGQKTKAVRAVLLVLNTTRQRHGRRPRAMIALTRVRIAKPSSKRRGAQ